MISLLADANVAGHVARLAAWMQSDYWRDFWEHLDLRCLSFADAGLHVDDLDSQVWRCCQEQRLVLLTNNRNDDDADSLEATIRTAGTAESLPVFTFRDADEVHRNPAYADRVVASLFEKLLRLESLRGTGRLWLP